MGPDDTMDVAPTEARAPAPPPAPGGPPPGPPRGWLLWENPWPWLAAFGIVVIAGVIIWLVLANRSSEKVVVPRVVGLREPAAVARLNHAELGARVVRRPSKRPLGLVLSQTPGAGARLKKHEKVSIQVAAAQPRPVTTAHTTTAAKPPPLPTVAVPNAVGKQQPEGAGVIEAAGLVADTFPANGSQPGGEVVSQDPSAGAQVKAGSTVRLTVSTGTGTRPAKAIPSVTGAKAGQARTQLWSAGFTVRTTYRQAPKAKVGLVLSQQPSGGTAPIYTQVTLVVGR